MKSIFILFLSLSSVIFGFSVRLRAQKRITNIQKCIILLENIATSIDFSLDDINKIVSKSSEILNLKFLDEFIRLDKSISLKERWKEAIERTYFFDCLKTEERNILLSFSDILGTTSKQGQINNCKLYSEMLKNTVDNLKCESAKKGNSSVVLGFLGALSLIIIFV